MMSDRLGTHIVIPARMASTRLPGKPLVDIAGLPMIVRVAKQASTAKVSSVVVAVDDQRVFNVVEAAGFEVVMTKVDHPSGSDRVMEVAQKMAWSDDDVVINVQGDEPLMPAEVINNLADMMRKEQTIELATLCEPISDSSDFLNPNIVKVVTDKLGDALYFSRASIPYPRDDMASSGLTEERIIDLAPQRHVGIYAFRVSALREFVCLTDSRLEKIEKLEQLRWLEAGKKLRVMQSPQSIPGGIDTPEDLQRVVEFILSTHK